MTFKERSNRAISLGEAEVATCQKTTLANGFRILSEKVPGARSVALGIWVMAGSRDESAEENGLAHLIEHMVFKGTPSRDVLEVARAIDQLGGYTNAYTCKETTCFHTQVMAAHFERAFDLLWDIFQNSLYDEEELERERQVILQEIAMVEDLPEELIYDLLSSANWPGHPLGRPVAGTAESVSDLSRLDILSYLNLNYQANRILICAAGAVDHEQLLEMVDRRGFRRGSERTRNLTQPDSVFGLTVVPKKLEQAHLALSLSFPSQTDDRRYAASILNVVLGGNMSSRLFQEIRERRGLVYTVYSNYTAFEDIGTLTVYAGAAPKRLPEALEVVLGELANLRVAPLSEGELVAARENITAGIVLAGESLENRMTRLARDEINFGRQITLEEVTSLIDQVDQAAVTALAEEFFALGRIAVCVLGPVKGSAFKNIAI